MGFQTVDVSLLGHYQGEKESFAGEGNATFTVRVQESVYDKSTKESEYVTRFWDFKVFGKSVDRVRSLAKGTPIKVTGELDRLSTWSKDGVEQFNVSLVANKVAKCPPDFSNSEESGYNGEKAEDMDDPMDEEPVPTKKVPPKKSVINM